MSLHTRWFGLSVDVLDKEKRTLGQTSVKQLLSFTLNDREVSLAVVVDLFNQLWIH